MRKAPLSILFSILCFIGFTQVKNQPLKLNNALVVSHLDKQADQFSLEIAVSVVLSQAKVNNTVSLNVLKAGGDPQVLMTDSLTQILQAKGINTLMLVSVRGFDNRFRPSSGNITLAEDLAADNLFPIYKDDITSVTFEFHFYRDGKLVYTDLLRIGGINSRDKVLRKLRKKLAKKVKKEWI
ncbi:hypothetical protein [Fluviicola taffensis]|uniref:Uncharacterized protein n=1 Tax=Fluviicola taffensis (strain DSM 16823 / NCIMB 13979 / RW262) TaxID=755732 RepID=F2IFX2_FLUTR|nr:hypothetical protein [Fluviicola taffensis]AEA43593.1 hypothetical protein Fluta_1601 [Fluviicola taffensis DSM 16823]